MLSILSVITGGVLALAGGWIGDRRRFRDAKKAERARAYLAWARAVQTYLDRAMEVQSLRRRAMMNRVELDWSAAAPALVARGDERIAALSIVVFESDAFLRDEIWAAHQQCEEPIPAAATLELEDWMDLYRDYQQPIMHQMIDILLKIESVPPEKHIVAQWVAKLRRESQ